MFLTKLTAFIMSVVISFTSGVMPLFWFGKKSYAPAESESVLLNVALISDTHSDSSYFHERSRILRRVFCGISRTDSLPDAVVIAGDVSNASDPKEYRMLEWSLEAFNKVENIIPAAGNHDVRACDTYEEAAGYFCDFASYCGIETDKTYYSTQLNGYYFIILGSEDKLTLEASISDEQVSWLDGELAKAVKSEKPVFVVCHQPLYGTNNVYYDPASDKNHGVGDSSDAIAAVLKKYASDYAYPVFYINGHLHHNFDQFTFDTGLCENLYCITLPSVTKTADGGLGMAVEVYSDKILLRARNYAECEWIDGYQYTVETKIAE